jgi:4-amino-4-deoxy-L-arabinose transferase-like glycosyltransferase
VLDGVRRHAVAVAVAVTVLARLPALTRPVRADEAGFLLVARALDPRADSPFGAYWVDRPPPLIWVFGGIDAIGDETALRLVGAVVAGLTVLLAARVAALVGPPRAVSWAAVLAAALLANPMIDIVAVKGELLALPLLLGSIALTLLATRRRSAWLAVAAGVAAMAAVGLKQNLATGLVFAGALLLTGALTGRIPGALRLGLAGLAGAAVPVLVTLGWARAEGVRLGELWYAAYGFRTDAARVIADEVSDAPERRALLLLVIAVATMLLPVLAGLVAHVRELWADDPPVVAATLAVVGFDLVALVLGGSYWQDYLLPLVPGAVLCVALLAGRESPGGRRMRVLVAAAVVSAVAAMAFWLAWNVTGQQEFDEVRTGEALADAAEPGDTLVVFGGRADLQHASGMSSPYPYLWSLPMRTRDPGYEDLRELLAGPDAPTWLVEWVDLAAWSDAGVPELEQVVEERYVEHGTTCTGQPVYLLKGEDRADVQPICD